MIQQLIIILKDNTTLLRTNEKLKVRGLNGRVETLETVSRKLKLKNHIVKQKFHILPKQVQTPVHGILEFNFLAKHEAERSLRKG